MNIEAVIRIGWARVPARLKTRVALSDPVSGATANNVEAIIVPASGSNGDSFEARALTRDRARRVVVRAIDLAGYVPAENQAISWGGTTYNILAATPTPETDPIIWRLTVQR